MWPSNKKVWRPLHQTNTGYTASGLYNASNTQNEFTLKCWCCHAFKVLHQLLGFWALCFAIFADAVVLFIFILQKYSWNHFPIFLFAPLFLHVKHCEASTLLWVENDILLDIGNNLWHYLVPRPVTSMGDQEGRIVFREGHNFFELCPKHFSRGWKSFLGGFAPCASPGYGPASTPVANQ